ncbi:SPW repeat protein [Nonomuraea wenchangensis]|uniref:SPW repeat-containing protein n=1 Tax=Nonomuraea wenchangensis TaxID=568860 RepID=A0A1H9YGB1_9ACTN|nr:SPW repeat protein [Nonomuraea wenchangensis]SES67964.1 SPW repeat-containing protein [Nonomuraea wenchangensis]
MAHTSGTRMRPDIEETRQHYEEAACRAVFQALDGLTLLAGLYLAISPWVANFTPLGRLTVNNLVTGLAVAALAVGFATAYGRTHGLAWVTPIVGVWTIIAPWILYGGAAPGRAVLNNVVVGIWIALTGLAAAGLAASGRGRGRGRTAHVNGTRPTV